ncbi:MAG: hypothetical protein ABI467_01155 [Kofleriaceae bacterium]
MSRTIWLIPFLLIACGKSGGNQAEDTGPVTSGKVDRVALPTGDHVMVTKAGSGAPQSDEARFHLHPDEGTLTIDKAEGKAGTELVSTIKVTPAGAYHVNVEFPIKLTLEPPAGVKLAKTELTAGGMDKSQGDAVAFSEQALVFAVKATTDKAGTYDIKGTFKFAVCTNNNTQCLAKKQPITVTVAAN